MNNLEVIQNKINKCRRDLHRARGMQAAIKWLRRGATMDEILAKATKFIAADSKRLEKLLNERRDIFADIEEEYYDY